VAVYGGVRKTNFAIKGLSIGAGDSKRRTVKTKLPPYLI